MRIGSSLRRLLGRKRKRQRVPDDPDQHPERLAVLPYCEHGRGIDVGCGHRKSSPQCIGVDLTPGGQRGEFGVVRNQVSQADICSSGDDLPMFQDGELDFVVARHNLEHYVDVIKTLREWKRVLRPGGTLALVVPDERHVDTIALDPTHKHVFTPESLDRYLDAIGGFQPVQSRVVVENWSFLAVYQRLEPTSSSRS